MGEIADMTLNGTRDRETGEYLFDGEDGPGWPMTADDAIAFKRGTRPPAGQGRNSARNRRRRERKRAAKGAA